MLFHTLDFFIFFALFLAVYAPLKRNKLAIYVIAAFSVFFYGYWNWHYLPLLLVTVVIDFYIGLALEKQADPKKRKNLLVASLLLNFGLLFFFKYLNFLLTLVLPDHVAEQLKIDGIVLPPGIELT